MARSLRTRPRLNRMILSLIEEVTDFMDAASLVDFISIYPFLWFSPQTIGSMCVMLLMFSIECSNVLFAKGTIQNRGVYLHVLVRWDPDPRDVTHPRRVR